MTGPDSGAYGRWTGLLVLSIAVASAVLLPGIDEFLESHEGLHHAQHAAAVAAGAVSGWAAYKLLRIASSTGSGAVKRAATAMLIANHRSNPGGMTSLMVALGVIVFWHIPHFFNMAVLDDTVHIIQHLSLVVAGGAVGVGIPRMGRWTKLVLPLAAELILLLSAAIIVVLEVHVYRTYPYEHEWQMSVAMVYIMMPAMLYTVYRFLVAQVS